MSPHLTESEGVPKRAGRVSQVRTSVGRTSNVERAVGVKGKYCIPDGLLCSTLQYNTEGLRLGVGPEMLLRPRT